jgi:hypothetical protein
MLSVANKSFPECRYAECRCAIICLHRLEFDLSFAVSYAKSKTDWILDKIMRPYFWSYVILLRTSCEGDRQVYA